MQHSAFPTEEILDLLYHLPLQAYVELNRWLLTSISSLPTGAASSGCPENLYPVRGRIWQHALRERRGVKLCAFPIGMAKECAAGNLIFSIF